MIIESRICRTEWVESVSPLYLLKNIQLIRLITRDKDVFESLNGSIDISAFINILNDLLQKTQEKLSGVVPSEENISTTVHINVEVVSMFKRLSQIEGVWEIFQSRNICANIMDLISINNLMVLRNTLDMISYIFEKVNIPKILDQLIEEFGQIYYIGKLLFVCEKLDVNFKFQSINLITKLMDFPIVCENFRRIHGISTFINELKKTDSLNLKIAILNGMFKLLQKTECVHDFKVFGIVPILQSTLNNGKTFIEISLTINILSLLILDDDLSVKILDSGLQSVTRFLLDCHPINKHKIAFKDISPDAQDQAILELEMHCFKLLRFLFSIEKNRKLFKLLFPPKLFGIFIDIGNYVKVTSRYKSLAVEFNNLPESEIHKIEQSLVEINKDLISLTTNFNRLKSFGSYTLLELIGKGAFGTVFLVKKGENKYALK